MNKWNIRIVTTIALALAASMTAAGMTVLAAPRKYIARQQYYRQINSSTTMQEMDDGGLFDPVYYAQKYPEVAALIGTDTETLYQHYKTNGIARGRLPYAGAEETQARLMGSYTITDGDEDENGTYAFYLITWMPSVATVSDDTTNYGAYKVTDATMVLNNDKPQIVVKYTCQPLGDSIPSIGLYALMYDEAGTMIATEYVWFKDQQQYAIEDFYGLDLTPGDYYIDIVS